MLLVAILQDKYWYLHSEGFQRVCNECSTNKSVAQMLPRWLRICSKWSTFRRPAASRTPEDVQHAQAAIKKDQQLTAQELEADWGIPKTTVSEILRVLAWIVSWQNSFRSFCYQGRRNIVLQLLMTWFKPLPMNRIWQLLALWKTKFTLEREEISNHWWDSGKYKGAADGNSNKGFCSVLNSGRDAGKTEARRCLLWKVLRHQWAMYSVSCILHLLQ